MNITYTNTYTRACAGVLVHESDTHVESAEWVTDGNGSDSQHLVTQSVSQAVSQSGGQSVIQTLPS